MIMDRFEFKVNGVKITVSRDDEDGAYVDKAEPAKRKPVVNAPTDNKDAVSAAIAAAVHLYGQEWHDVENAVLTFNKVARAYTPWSAKFHGMNAYYKYRR